MTPRTPPARVALEARIGPALKRAREAVGLSLRTLAGRADVSPSFVSQVENGQASPSLASLERLTTAIGIRVEDLIAPAEPEPTISLTRAGQRVVVKSTWSRARIESLTAPSFSQAPRGLMVTLSPGGASGPREAVSGHDQLVVVFDGEITLSREGARVTLSRGDTAVIAAGSPHRWVNESAAQAQVMFLTSPHPVR